MTDELRLCCSRCAMVGSWIIPRPEMRDMVVEIAAHVGWCGVQGCDPLCPECGRPALPPEPLMIDGRLHWRGPLLELVGALRRDGKVWVDVAATVSRQVGFHVDGRHVAGGFYQSLQRARRAA